MWIRSQDQKILINLNAICINYENEREIIGWDIHADANICLGEYKNKERAMSVLNEIHCYIIKKSIYCNIYEMPEN